ncbi:MAG: hypothetical protein H7A26_03630 [Spirochaetales bacterium]|nr:hypothetical protein [Spirochaetales bacterium]
MSRHIIFTDSPKQNIFIIFLLIAFTAAFILTFYVSAEFTAILRNAVIKNINKDILLNHYELFCKVWALAIEMTKIAILAVFWVSASFLTITIYNNFIGRQKH